MLGSFHLAIDYRVAYLRFLLNLLYEKYHVNLTQLSKDAGFRPSFIHDLKSKRKGIGFERATELELFLNDLYGAIIEDEVPKDPQEFLEFVNELLKQDNLM